MVQSESNWMLVRTVAVGSSAASPAAAVSPAMTPANPTSASPEALPSPAPAPQALPSPSPSPEALPSPAPSTTPSPTPSPPQSPTPAASSEASPSPMLSSAPFSSPGATSPSPAPAAEPLPATTPNGTLFNLVAAAAQQSCPTIFQTLSLSPDLTIWVNLIQVGDCPDYHSWQLLSPKYGQCLAVVCTAEMDCAMPCPGGYVPQQSI